MRALSTKRGSGQPLYSLSEAASVVGVSFARLRRFINAPDAPKPVPGVGRSNQILYRLNELRAWAQKLQGEQHVA